MAATILETDAVRKKVAGVTGVPLRASPKQRTVSALPSPNSATAPLCSA